MILKEKMEENLESGARFDVVLFENVVEHRVQVFSDVFDHQRFPERQTVLDVRSEVLVIQRSQDQIPLLFTISYPLFPLACNRIQLQ